MLPESLRRVIMLLGRLPGVGEKTAQRFALKLMTEPELALELGAELAALPGRIRPCVRCGNLAEVGWEASEQSESASDADEKAVCSVCRDRKRDGSLLCVVARVQDLLAIERSGAMRGRYFVLGRLLSPLDGIGPDELPLDQLAHRLAEDQVREVILATPPSVDGEATALYLGRELTQRGIGVSRIASGVPHGGDLEFADQITLGRAIEGRRQLDKS